ncbi:MAG: PAS domain S-box protein [Verrucomicrobiia bacterium]
MASLSQFACRDPRGDVRFYFEGCCHIVGLLDPQTRRFSSLASIAPIILRTVWLILWFSGVAPRWGAEGAITVKTNMALAQVLGGLSLLLLGSPRARPLQRRVGQAFATIVLLVGMVTLSEHIFHYNAGIDQLLAAEPPGAAATVSPNRIGPPGSLSLVLLGAGLLLLASRPRLAQWLGLGTCVINLIPAVGFLYGIAEFYSNPRLTGIAWSTVIALSSLGAGLILARPAQGPVAQLLRGDPGGVLLRRLVPAIVLIPLLLGFLGVQGEGGGYYGTAVGTGSLVITIVVGFLFILWRTAATLSHTAEAKAKVEREVRRAKELSEAVTRFSQVLHSTLDSDEIIRRIVVEGAAALGSESAAISEKDGNGWRVRYVHGLPEELVGQRVDDEQERHALAALETREVVAIEDGFNDGRFNRVHLRRANIRSVLVAPILIRNEAFGVVFFNYHKGTHVFTEGELNFVKQLAATAGSALGNARLFDEQKRAEELVRRRAEEALRLSEQEFCSLAEAVPQIVWATRPDGRNIYFNQQWVEYTGMTMEESYGHGWNTPFHPDDKQRAWEAWQRATQYQEQYSLECRLRRADGAYRWWLIRGEPLRGAKGEILKWFGTCTDIEELKQGEVELQQAKERLEERVAERTAALQQAHQRLLYHTGNTPLAVIEFDADMRVSGWSGQAQQVFGWEASEVLGKRIFEVPWILKEDLPALEKVAADLYSGETPRSVSPNRNVRKDGTVIWCEWYNSSLTDATGKMVSIQSLVLDVTERKEAEEALARSERLYRAIGESIDYGIWVCDAQGRNIYASDSFLKLVGITQEQCSEFGWGDMLHPEDTEATIAAWKQCVQSGGPWYREHRFRGADGQWHPILACGVAVRNDRGEITHWAGINLDISRLKATEGDLRKARDELAKTNANLERLVAERTAKLQELVGELEHFSYTITHDLKSPLRAMRSFAEMAAELCDESGPKEAKEFLGRISTAAERMDALIRDALNYSRAVRQELTLENVDTGRLLRGMLDSYPELQPSKANIRVEGELPMVLGNEAGLTQCFSNLLGNAVKFVKPGQTPEIRVWAELLPQGQNPQAEEHWVRIWVEDKGIGISKEMLPRIFDMFSRANKSYEGTGIGLALVRKVTQVMGGKVGAQSEEGKGSRFWIELKSAEVRPAPRQAEAAPENYPQIRWPHWPLIGRQVADEECPALGRWTSLLEITHDGSSHRIWQR